ncbi:hypothetical protein [Streptomyces sp. NPDC001530]|uniref:hypothetical protein n=1 Tax=Streptomyces sp. NPDC001530 TaxID=3364582 RepID=UPI0036B0FE8C
MGFSVTLPLSSGTLAAPRRLGLTAFGTAALVSVWAAGATTASLGVDLLLSDRTAVISSALLISVFGGRALAKAATVPVGVLSHRCAGQCHRGVDDGHGCSSGDWAACPLGDLLELSGHPLIRKLLSLNLPPTEYVIAGCPLPEVLAWKEELDREKDQEDIRLIRRHLRRSGA